MQCGRRDGIALFPTFLLAWVNVRKALYLCETELHITETLYAIMTCLRSNWKTNDASFYETMVILDIGLVARQRLTAVGGLIRSSKLVCSIYDQDAYMPDAIDPVE